MSSLWFHAPPTGWESALIGEGSPLPGREFGLEGIAFVRYGCGADKAVALLAQPEVRVWVNGQPVLGGLRILEHKDEILCGQQRLFFSAETTPVIVPYPAKAGARLPTCPVCRGAIKDGLASVQCPGCGRWYHEIAADAGQPGRLCWSYAPTCRFCNHPTAFSEESAWRPEKEELHA